MTTQPLQDILQMFRPISLEETTGKAGLLDRVDAKYPLSYSQMTALIQECKKEYHILEINGIRSMQYKTTYYDTADLAYYHAHHAGHFSRLKIRVREYIDNQSSFLELKQRNNHGRTIKTRSGLPAIHEDPLEALEQDVFADKLHLQRDDLNATVTIEYNRITLVRPETAERVTIDYDLRFSFGNESKLLEDFAIAECKQIKSVGSPFKLLMKQHHIREGSISKYCLGIILLYPHVKKNRFKPFLLKLKKITPHAFVANQPA